jgi:DNA-binding NarL/FixJ family response regulator
MSTGSSTDVRVVVVDDEALVRAGLRAILETAGGIDVVGDAADGEQALVVTRASRPDVVLMDVQMPRLGGLDAARQILADPHGPRVIMLTTFDLDEYVYAAMRAGASGFLVKDTPREQLIAAVRTVSQGDALLSSSVARRLVDRFARPQPSPPPLPTPGQTLSARELDIWRALARGRTNAEIASELYISEATVKTHVGHVLAKLGLRDRIQAVIVAYETGLVAPGGSPTPT